MIGAYPTFSIKQARDRHEELRVLVERGQSPAKAKRVLSAVQKVADAGRLNFRSFAQRWVDETLFYRSGGYVAQTARWLNAYVYSAIGDMPLDEVQPGDVRAIIKACADTAVTGQCSAWHGRSWSHSLLLAVRQPPGDTGSRQSRGAVHTPRAQR